MSNGNLESSPRCYNCCGKRCFTGFMNNEYNILPGYFQYSGQIWCKKLPGKFRNESSMINIKLLSDISGILQRTCDQIAGFQS